MRLRRNAVAAIWAVALLFCLPALAHATEWEEYLSDDFTSAETMFYTGPAGSAFYSINDDGQYVIDGMNSNVDSLSALTDNLYYYYVEAQCEVLDSSAGELAFAGLVFHYNKRVKPGAYSYYVFYIYGDGYYGAKRVIGDKVEIVLPLTRSDMIDPNAPNVLAVDAQGTRFDLYINGRYVDGFTDVRIDGGGFGFYISKNTKAVFDDFKVKVERRATGKEDTDQPQPEGSNSPDSDFHGYKFPNIPRDPNRPLYPWEVGYDKSGKKKPEHEPPPPDDNSAKPDDQNSGDEGASGDNGSAGQEEPSVPPDEELVNPDKQPPGAAPPPKEPTPPPKEPPAEESGTIQDKGDASSVVLVPASELPEQKEDVKVSPAEKEKSKDEDANAAEGGESADADKEKEDAGKSPIEDILGNLKDKSDKDKSGEDEKPAEDETYTAPKDSGDLSLFPEEETKKTPSEQPADTTQPADDSGLLSAEPSAVAGAGGEPAPPAPGVTTITDDFTERNWPESQDEVSSYSYFGGAYQIDNLQADTMAISFKKGDFSDAEVAVDAEYLEGRSDVGFGLGARFRVENASVSYYGLFIAGSGEFLLLKVVGGQEKVLKDWTKAPMIHQGAPNTIKLELVGSTINAYINGELVTTVRDSDIRSGGYALLAGPGLAARYDNFSLRGVEAGSQ